MLRNDLYCSARNTGGAFVSGWIVTDRQGVWRELNLETMSGEVSDICVPVAGLTDLVLCAPGPAFAAA